MLYFKTLKKHERRKYVKYNLFRDFFRMMYIPKPIFKKRKSRYTIYFYHRLQFRLFYGCLKTKYIKNAIRLSKKKKKCYFVFYLFNGITIRCYYLSIKFN